MRFSEDIIPKWTVKVALGQHPNEFVDAHIEIGLLQFCLQKFEQGGFAGGGSAVDEDDGGHNKNGSLATPALLEREKLAALCGQGCKALHQAALATRDIILVNNALFGSLVQCADGVHDSVFGVGRAGDKGFARSIIGSAGGATDGAVTQAALFVLTIAFDLRLNVSQGRPPKIRTFL